MLRNAFLFLPISLALACSSSSSTDVPLENEIAPPRQPHDPVEPVAPNDSVAPVDPSVVGGWSTAGTGSAYFQGAAAFASGGAFLLIEHRGTLDIPLASGDIHESSGQMGGPDRLLGLWLNDDGGVRHVINLGTELGGSLHVLREDLLLQLQVGSGGVLLPDAEAIVAATPERHLLRISPLGKVSLLAQVTGTGGASALSAFAEGDDGTLFLAGPRGLTVSLTSGPTLEAPASDSAEIASVQSFFARVGTNDEVSLVLFEGTGTSHINALMPAPSGDIWICGDVGGFGDVDNTVVLDPGGPTETTLTAIAPDDDPASDLFFARISMAGSVRTAWLQYGYNNEMERACDLATFGDDLLVAAPSSPRYAPDENDVWRQRWTWTEPDGDLVALPASTTYDALTLARYSNTGDLRWFSYQDVFGQGEMRMWLDGEAVRIHVDAYDGNTLFPDTANASVASTQPESAYVGAQLTLDHTSGAPIGLAGGGTDVRAMLQDGRFLIATDTLGGATVGAATDSPFTCPDSELPQVCVVVLQPGTVTDGRFVQ